MAGGRFGGIVRKKTSQDITTRSASGTLMSHAHLARDLADCGLAHSVSPLAVAMIQATFGS
jgi:hypothetical protein